jgi:hypothetical protein
MTNLDEILKECFASPSAQIENKWDSEGSITITNRFGFDFNLDELKKLETVLGKFDINIEADTDTDDGCSCGSCHLYYYGVPIITLTKQPE